MHGKAHPGGQGWQLVDVINPIVLTASHFRQSLKYRRAFDLFPACGEIMNADRVTLDVLFVQQRA
jgi:hypothetical protein